jgi:ParB-like chromosome segregation protein Spo0J
MKLSKIKPNPNNPRTIKDWQYQKLRNNILSFKKMLCIRPIVTDDNNQIIGGNMRFRVLQDLAKSGELEALTGLPKNEVPD